MSNSQWLTFLHSNLLAVLLWKQNYHVVQKKFRGKGLKAPAPLHNNEPTIRLCRSESKPTAVFFFFLFFFFFLRVNCSLFSLCVSQLWYRSRARSRIVTQTCCSKRGMRDAAHDTKQSHSVRKIKVRSVTCIQAFKASAKQI